MSKMIYRMSFCSFIVLVGILFVFLNSGFAAIPEAGPYQSKKCLRCHADFADEENVLTGDFQSRSGKAKTIQVKVNDKMEIVKFTEGTTVENVENIKALKKPIPVKVHYEVKGKELIATDIVAKPVIKVPEEKLVSVEEMAKYVEMGPQKGNFTLVDARPGIRYEEGHIPGSISIPFAKFMDRADRLPKDKDSLLIFYCGGFR